MHRGCEPGRHAREVADAPGRLARRPHRRSDLPTRGRSSVGSTSRCPDGGLRPGLPDAQPGSVFSWAQHIAWAHVGRHRWRKGLPPPRESLPQVPASFTDLRYTGLAPGGSLPQGSPRNRTGTQKTSGTAELLQAPRRSFGSLAGHGRWGARRVRQVRGHRRTDRWFALPRVRSHVHPPRAARLQGPRDQRQRVPDRPRAGPTGPGRHPDPRNHRQQRPRSPRRQDPLPRSARSRRSQSGRARVRSAHLSCWARDHPGRRTSSSRTATPGSRRHLRMVRGPDLPAALSASATLLHAILLLTRHEVAQQLRHHPAEGSVTERGPERLGSAETAGSLRAEVPLCALVSDGPTCHAINAHRKCTNISSVHHRRRHAPSLRARPLTLPVSERARSTWTVVPG